MRSKGPIILVEPWYHESHRRFVDGYAAHSHHRIRIVHLMGNSWQHHMRFGAIPLSEMLNELPEPPGAILCSDYVNLPVLQSFCPRFADVPWLLYFHEDQLTYPSRPGLSGFPEFSAINIQSALAADVCVFPTHAALNAFAEALLSTGGGHYDPVAIMNRIIDRSKVCPVGCDFSEIDAIRKRTSLKTDPLLHILWPHRHAHDKNPEDFFASILQLAAERLDFRISVLGEPRPDAPPIIAETIKALRERVVHLGFKTGADYAAVLCESDLVVSTAFQETLGLAVIEAMRAGCRPLLPKRLSYPEILGAGADPSWLYENPPELKKKLRAAILNPQAVRDAAPDRPSLDRFAWSQVAEKLDAIVQTAMVKK